MLDKKHLKKEIECFISQVQEDRDNKSTLYINTDAYSKVNINGIEFTFYELREALSLLKKLASKNI